MTGNDTVWDQSDGAPLTYEGWRDMYQMELLEKIADELGIEHKEFVVEQ